VERSRAADEQCRARRPFAFIVHGLWPQLEHGFPRACVNPAPRIPEDLIRSALDLMPARGLIIHEWREHGTCTGLDPRQYFDAVRRARERIKIPARFSGITAHQMVTPDEIEESFRDANPALAADMIAVTCDEHRLREVRVCLTRDFDFRACPQIDRRACRVPHIVMPPVRGG
jgi:ribonuclease T2